MADLSRRSVLLGSAAVVASAVPALPLVCGGNDAILYGVDLARHGSKDVSSIAAYRYVYDKARRTIIVEVIGMEEFYRG